MRDYADRTASTRQRDLASADQELVYLETTTVPVGDGMGIGDDLFHMCVCDNFVLP